MNIIKFIEDSFTIKLVMDSHKEGYVDGMAHFSYGWITAIIGLLLIPKYIAFVFIGLFLVFFFQEMYQANKCIGCPDSENWLPHTWTQQRYQDIAMPVIAFLAVVGLFKLFS